MRPVFADTSYWVAVFDLADPLHTKAVETVAALGERPIVTTEPVLCEFLNFVSRQRSDVRRGAIRFVRMIQSGQRITCITPDHALFLAAMALYESRPDKTYSLTDCISMLVMRQQGLRDVLTTDRHFSQEGFRVLLPTAETP